MPGIIAPVMLGRCRPSPDRVSESASADGDRSGVMASHVTVFAGERLAPVLVAPHRCVCRIHRDDREAVFGAHGDDAGLELACGHAGDEPAEALLAGLLRGEVQVLDADRPRAGLLGPVQEPGEGVQDLGIAVFSAARTGRGPTGGPTRDGMIPGNRTNLDVSVGAAGLLGEAQERFARSSTDRSGTLSNLVHAFRAATRASRITLWTAASTDTARHTLLRIWDHSDCS